MFFASGHSPSWGQDWGPGLCFTKAFTIITSFHSKGPHVKAILWLPLLHSFSCINHSGVNSGPQHWKYRAFPNLGRPCVSSNHLSWGNQPPWCEDAQRAVRRHAWWGPEATCQQPASVHQHWMCHPRSGRSSSSHVSRWLQAGLRPKSG